MNNLYDALETCLNDIENGADVEAVLLGYPEIAEELRPILQASVNAKGLAAPAPTADVMTRNRAQLLQHASEMRATRVKSLTRFAWPAPLVSLRRVAVTFIVLVTFLASGTGLVRAASTTLPGDNLYPIKRTWEDVTLLFTFNMQRRASLAVEHENERLEECYELIAEGRSAKVDFAGIVTQQNGDEWMVSGITIVISPQTDFHDGPVVVGDAVRVFGILQGNDSVLVERIEQLPSGAQLPDIGNSNDGSNSGSGSGNDNNDNDVANENDSSGPGNGNDNSNDNNSGPGAGNDNSNDNNSGPGGGMNSGNDNNSGPVMSGDSGNDNSNVDNSVSGSGDTNTNGDSSGSGSGSNDSDDNSGSGGGGSDDNGNEDNSGSGGGD